MAHLAERLPETLMSVIFSLDWIHHDFFCALDLLIDPIYRDFLVRKIDSQYRIRTHSKQLT